MRRVIAGAVLLAAGIGAFIVAASHRPESSLSSSAHAIAREFGGRNVLGVLSLNSPATGWSQTAYDLTRIGGLALLILGAVVLASALIRAARQAPDGASSWVNRRT